MYNKIATPNRSYGKASNGHCSHFFAQDSSFVYRVYQDALPSIATHQMLVGIIGSKEVPGYGLEHAGRTVRSYYGVEHGGLLSMRLVTF
jgi:hypothetical protein